MKSGSAEFKILNSLNTKSQFLWIKKSTYHKNVQLKRSCFLEILTIQILVEVTSFALNCPWKEWANARIKEEQEFQNHEIREYTTLTPKAYSLLN